MRPLRHCFSPGDWIGTVVSSVWITRDCLHARGHQLHQRPHQLAGRPHPGAHRAAGHVHLLPREDVFQPVQRQVIAQLAGDDVGQQARAGQALVDRLRRLGRRVDVRVVAVVRRTCAQAYLWRMCFRTLKLAGKYSSCSLISAPIRCRSTPAGRAGFLASARSCSISIRSRCSGNCCRPCWSRFLTRRVTSCLARLFCDAGFVERQLLDQLAEQQKLPRVEPSRCAGRSSAAGGRRWPLSIRPHAARAAASSC